MTRAERIAERRRAVGSRKPPTKAELDELREVYGAKVICPNCNTVKAITDFGIRRNRGLVTKQPWCKTCRASTNYHNRPRVYRSKNA